MKILSDGYTHHAKLEICGSPDDSGNGVQLNPGAASASSTIDAVGDDTNVGIKVRSKGTGVLALTANSQDRLIVNPSPKTIVDGSATSLFEVVCTAAQMVGGRINFLVRASDGTDHQALAGSAVYAAVNKAGTITATVTYTTAPEAKAVTGASTLTLAFTIVDSTNKATVKVQPTGSLTETTYTIEYDVQPIRGAVTIL